jgi:hypothetical protein
VVPGSEIRLKGASVSMLEILNTVSRVCSPLIEAAGVSPADVRAGLEALEYGAAKLGLEAGHAASCGIPLARAVQDGERFPALRAFHLSVRDVLTMNLPPDLLPNARRACEVIPALPEVEEFRLELARRACDRNAPHASRALARLVLFEAVRLNVLVCTWEDAEALTRVGVEDEDVDANAERQVDTLIANADVLAEPNPVRPLDLLVAAALEGLRVHVDQAREAVRCLTVETHEELARRARLEALLNGLDAEQAILIRNSLAPRIGEQRLSVERLIAAHPMLFDGQPRNAIDQRLCRLRTSILDRGEPPTPRGVRLIDVIRDAS